MDLQLHNELEIPPFFSWVNPLFRLGHFQVRKLLVDQREMKKTGIWSHLNNISIIIPLENLVYLVNVYITMENHHFQLVIHYKWAIFNRYITVYPHVPPRRWSWTRHIPSVSLASCRAPGAFTKARLLRVQHWEHEELGVKSWIFPHLPGEGC